LHLFPAKKQHKSGRRSTLVKKISIDTSRMIAVLSENGLSLREIARRLDLGHVTVHRHLEHLKTSDPKHCEHGRPKKLSDRIIKQFLRLVGAGHLKNASDVAEYIFSVHSIKVSKWTIARILHSHGFKNYAKPRKPRLTVNHKKARHNFARTMARFPDEAWKHVIFTDESKICAFGPDGNRRVWRRPGSRLLDHHITPRSGLAGSRS